MNNEINHKIIKVLKIYYKHQQNGKQSLYLGKAKYNIIDCLFVFGISYNYITKASTEIGANKTSWREVCAKKYFFSY